MATKKRAVKSITKTSKKATTIKAKNPAKKASPKKQKELKTGSNYKCYTCGLTVTVDNICGCVDFCDIICCGGQMKPE